ncbi:ogr/Delta-like zinc finger family protein [Pantoea sp. C3]|uniref:ogr/Delta-like zinc finger family protein n=1 Tax=Pantoea phytostimulans TaxID=2769024 RepID=UPI0038F69AC5
MALKCPECGCVAHTRTSAYEAPSVKRTWYQCRNLDCSCTFTALESVEKIIMKPHKSSVETDKIDETPPKKPQTLNRYGSASKLSNRQQSPV